MTDQPKPAAVTFVITAIALLIMAFFLAGLIGHLGDVTLARGAITGFFCWLAFIATSLCVNHRFQAATWSLTLIDGGHWLGVLLIQGMVIGLFGA